MKKKYAIYTVQTGGYDNIAQPEVTDADFDYICFVGKGEGNLHHTGFWSIVEIDVDIKDKGRLSRYPKILPHKTLLSEYEYSLYIDANIIIKDRYIYDRVRELASNDVKIGLLQHPFRDCVYQEAYVCIAACKGGWIDILRQIRFLKRNGIEKHSGLYEANVIFRKHGDNGVVNMDDEWWNTFMKYSKRDQLSLVYALNNCVEPVTYLLPPGFTTRNHYAFQKIAHLPKKVSFSMKVKHFIIRLLSKVSKKLLKE